jgi:cyclophilin family peptidyl-prolyl cis-trans isomerase
MRLVWAVAAVALASACSKKEPVKVPETFHVKFVTSEGDFTVEANRAWAPRGVDRFHELLRMKYFDEGRFFRVVPNFIAQFGVHKDYATHAIWRELFIVDDRPVGDNRHSNTRGTLAFAQSGPNTRATEIFINLKDNPMLDEEGFVPFAKVTEGMDVVDRLYSGYGELRPTGRYIEPGRVEEGGNSYLAPRFPNLDYIKKTEILQ